MMGVGIILCTLGLLIAGLSVHNHHTRVIDKLPDFTLVPTLPMCTPSPLLPYITLSSHIPTMHMQKDVVIHDTSSISSLYGTLIAYIVDASSS